MARRKVTQAEIEAAAAAPLKYFSHDAHLADSTACRRFIRRCGPDGYGRFMRLLERLATEEGHVIDVLDTESQYLLADELWFGDNLAAMGQFLKDLSECGLVKMFGDGVIKSPVVDEAALFFGKRRAIGATGGRPRKEGSENA